MRTPEGYAIEVRLASITPAGVRDHWQRYTRQDIGEDFAAHAVLVQCPCGQRYVIDVIALLNGQEVTVAEYGVDPRDTFGVEPDRLSGGEQGSRSDDDDL